MVLRVGSNMICCEKLKHCYLLINKLATRDDLFSREIPLESSTCVLGDNNVWNYKSYFF